MRLLALLYTILPTTMVNFLGKASMLKPLRDRLLRKGGKSRLISEKIVWQNQTILFRAPIRIAIKAKQKGIENQLLRIAISYLDKLKGGRPLIIDVGANYGFVSLILAARYPEGRVISFEPHPDIIDSLRESKEKNRFFNLDIKHAAVGSQNGFLDVSLFDQTSSSVLQSVEGNSGRLTRVPLVSLDAFLEENNLSPDLIKIDVDGYEIEVLKGLHRTIDLNHPVLIIETNGQWELANYLVSRGYRVCDTLDNLVQHDLPANIFAVHPSFIEKVNV